jgi:hypothetical protein
VLTLATSCKNISGRQTVDSSLRIFNGLLQPADHCPVSVLTILKLVSIALLCMMATQLSSPIALHRPCLCPHQQHSRLSSASRIRQAAVQVLCRPQAANVRAQRRLVAPCRAQETEAAEGMAVHAGAYMRDVRTNTHEHTAVISTRPLSAVETASSTETASSRPAGDWVPVIKPDEFPKGAPWQHACCCSSCHGERRHWMSELASPHTSQQSQLQTPARCNGAIMEDETRTPMHATGVRKEVRVDGVDVLLFWYRNDIYAIEARCAGAWFYSPHNAAGTRWWRRWPGN